MASRFSVEAVFKAVDRISAPVTRMQNRIGKATRSINRGFKRINKTIKTFASGIKRASVVAGAALASIGFAMFDVITIGADFSRALGAAAAKFPGDIKRGTKEFKALRDTAREVGKTTEFTSVQAARGLNFLAKAGFDAAFAMRMLKPIVDFATASELDFAEAADIASDALGAFGLDSEDAEKKAAGMARVMDVMAKAANSSNQSVTELFESAKKSAPLAVAAGASIETFSAQMAVLAGNGIKASVAGTASKNVTLGLVGVTSRAAKALGILGIKTETSTGALRDQLDVLDDLRERFKTLTPKQRLQFTEQIFGKLSIAAANILLSDAGKKVRVLREEFEGAAGESRKMAAFIRDDVRGSLDSFKSAVEGVKISIFTMNEGPLKETIDRMTDWVRANEALIATNIGGFLADVIENIDEIAATVVKIAKWTAAILALVIAFKALALILTVVNLLVAANPIVLIVLAAIAAVGAIVLLVKNINKIASSIMGLSNVTIAAFGLMAGPIGLMIAAPILIKKNWESIKVFFSDLWADITDIFDRGIGKILGLIDKVKNAPGTALDLIAGVLGITPNNVNGDNAQPQIAGPQERAAGIINESRTVDSSEVTIRDETGRAEITNRGRRGGSGLVLQQTGAF